MKNLSEEIRSKAVKEPSASYFAHPSMSCSMIREILRSPAHFKYRYIDGHKDKDTPAKLFGTITHTALLEPRRFLDQYVIAPDLNKNTNAYKDWKAGLPAETLILKREEADAIITMCENVSSHPVAGDLLRGATMEHSLYFEEEETGIQCRVRPDAITDDGYVVDLKTTRNASREQFMRSIANYRYDISAGLYTHAFERVFKQPPKGYVFIAIESDAPYSVAVYIADASVVEVGLAAARRGLKAWKACVEADRWPGYQDDVAENISLPHWMIQDADLEGAA